MFGQSILGFSAVAAVVVLMPGADTLLVMTTSLRDGPRAGLVTALGVVCGPVLWGAFTGLGVALLLSRHPAASGAIAAAGGLYVCYLGWRSCSGARVTWRCPAGSAPVADGQATNRNHFTTGLMTNVLNPKIGIFYLSVLPGLFVGQQITLWLGVLLGLIHAALGATMLTGVALLAGAAQRRLASTTTRAGIEFIGGLGLFGFGLYALTRSIGMYLTT
ncbi:LysE family translocator [Mycobacterium sp. MBM]|nr:LysE family translocator [Mycobacterium sp. MBM]